MQVCGSGLAAARIGLHIERKLLALAEIMHSSALDRRNVNEHIGAAVVLNDKAEALLGVEELNGNRFQNSSWDTTRTGTKYLSVADQYPGGLSSANVAGVWSGERRLWAL